MDDEKDPVVSRMKVYLSKRLSKNLVVLQYPVRSAGKTYDSVEVTAARAKPRQHSVELEMAFDVKGEKCWQAGNTSVAKMVIILHDLTCFKFIALQLFIIMPFKAFANDELLDV